MKVRSTGFGGSLSQSVKFPRANWHSPLQCLSLTPRYHGGCCFLNDGHSEQTVELLIHQTEVRRCLTIHQARIRRPAGVSDWKVLFLFLWLVLVPLFSCFAFLLRLNQGRPPPPPPVITHLVCIPLVVQARTCYSSCFWSTALSSSLLLSCFHLACTSTSLGAISLPCLLPCSGLLSSQKLIHSTWRYFTGNGTNLVYGQ